MLELSKPWFKGNEWTYLKNCLESGWVSSSGPYVSQFEDAMVNYLGASHAIATVSGTSAIHIALILAGVNPGDDVLLPTFTFIAPANAVRYCGAFPIFLDVDPQTCNLDAKALMSFLQNECDVQNGSTINKTNGRRVSAVLLVHLYGHAADRQAILDLAQRYHIPVVEDAAESLGCKINGKPLGFGSELLCFSFNGNKVITTGGGGMIITSRENFAQRARHLTTQAKVDPIEYQHDEVGYNYRMPSLNAALGLAQLEQLDLFLDKKREIAKYYLDGLKKVDGLRMYEEIPGIRSSFWLINIFIDRGHERITARDLRDQLDKKGIKTRLLWMPLHRQKAYQNCQAYNIVVADRLWEEGLSLPSSCQLTKNEMDFVISEIKHALKH